MFKIYVQWEIVDCLFFGRIEHYVLKQVQIGFVLFEKFVEFFHNNPKKSNKRKKAYMIILSGLLLYLSRLSTTITVLCFISSIHLITCYSLLFCNDVVIAFFCYWGKRSVEEYYWGVQEAQECWSSGWRGPWKSYSGCIMLWLLYNISLIIFDGFFFFLLLPPSDPFLYIWVGHRGKKKIRERGQCVGFIINKKGKFAVYGNLKNWKGRPKKDNVKKLMGLSTCLKLSGAWVITCEERTIHKRAGENFIYRKRSEFSPSGWDKGAHWKAKWWGKKNKITGERRWPSPFWDITLGVKGMLAYSTCADHVM